MKHSRWILWLVCLIVILGVTSAAAGLFLEHGNGPFTFTTLHGQSVRMYGDGLYRNETLFKAPILRGTDLVTLVICIPLLIAATVRYEQGSLRGGLLLTGVLAYFLYNSASLAFGAAYNELFLLYIAYVSVSLFTFVLAFTSIDATRLAGRIASSFPRRPVAVFLFVAGLSTFVWLIEIVAALVQGGVPETLAGYTTETTSVIDIGIIAPTAFLAGILILRRAPLGYPLACILLVVNAIIGVVVVAQTVVQFLAGITLTTAEIAIYVGTFVLMSLVAARLVYLFFDSISDGTTEAATHVELLPSEQRLSGDNKPHPQHRREVVR